MSLQITHNAMLVLLPLEEVVVLTQALLKYVSSDPEGAVSQTFEYQQSFALDRILQPTFRKKLKYNYTLR